MEAGDDVPESLTVQGVDEDPLIAFAEGCEARLLAAVESSLADVDLDRVRSWREPLPLSARSRCVNRRDDGEQQQTVTGHQAHVVIYEASIHRSRSVMRASVLFAISMAIISALSGCGLLTESRAHAPFRITTDHASYAPSYVVSVDIANVSGNDATYNLCPVAIQRRVSDGWQTVVRYPAGGVCTAEARLLRAGESIETRVGVPYDLADGTYRIVFPWLGDSTLPDDARATPSFVVAKPPIVAVP